MRRKPAKAGNWRGSEGRSPWSGKRSRNHGGIGPSPPTWRTMSRRGQPSLERRRGVAEGAPGAYKDVSAVADAADQAKLTHKVARLEPLICLKG
ncbi:MAG: RtcB family protein [Deltaproteobacteria bacterium]|nr:RtcB family protein [Deltaproteobacteria bacterium]